MMFSRDEDDNEHGVFIGTQPYRAAPKAVNRSEGTKFITGNYLSQGTWDQEGTHFQGMETNFKAPENRPSWMPEKINKSFVKKEKSRDNRII